MKSTEMQFLKNLYKGSGSAKWILKWRDHGTLKIIVDHDKNSFWFLDALEWLKQ